MFLAFPKRFTADHRASTYEFWEVSGNSMTIGSEKVAKRLEKMPLNDSGLRQMIVLKYAKIIWKLDVNGGALPPLRRDRSND